MKSTAAKKAAKKKVASKTAQVADPNAKALPSVIKILYKGPKDTEFTAYKQSDLFEKRGKALGVDAGVYRSMIRARANKVKEFDDGGNDKAKKAWIAAGKDWNAHTEERTRIETTKAAEEKSRLEAKEKAEKAMIAAREAGGSGALVVSMKSKMEELVSTNMKKHGIAYKDGKYTLAKGKKVTPELIAGALEEMSGMAAGSSELRDVACIAEARLAIFIQDDLNVDNWTDYFSDDPAAILRIKKYMTAVRRAGQISVTIDGEEKTVAEVIESGAMSFSNARTVLEAKFDKEDAEKNTATRAEVLQKVIDEGEASGTSIPQTRVRSIVADTKAEQSGGTTTARKPFGVFYVLISASGSVAVVGREKPDKMLDSVSAIIIDKGKQEYVNVLAGEAATQIDEPTSKQWQWIHAQVKAKGIEGDFTDKEMKEAGKASKGTDKPEKGKKPKKEVVEEESEEATEDEEVVEIDYNEETNTRLAEIIDEEEDGAEEAEEVLRKRCDVAGVDADDSESYDTWGAVAEALDDLEVDQSDEEEETEEEDSEEDSEEEDDSEEESEEETEEEEDSEEEDSEEEDSEEEDSEEEDSEEEDSEEDDGEEVSW